MQTPPVDVTDEQVLATAREAWHEDLTAVSYLAVGFGAHHWRADTPVGATLFLSLDLPNARHSLETYEQAYAAAAALGARGLEFVHPSVPTAAGAFTVPLESGVLSATAWVDGTRPDAASPEALDHVLRLHSADPPAGVRTWEPLVAPDLVDRLADWVSSPWTGGPLGELARSEVSTRLGDVEAWLRTYRAHVEATDPTTFVLTHGEPGIQNQWRRPDGRLLLVDWESVLLAPRERDLRSFEELAPEVVTDPAMLRMFDLEWRLDEIQQFADWLRGPHSGGEDDVIALGGLRSELQRA